MPADDPVQTVACANGGSDSRSWPGEALSGLEEGRMSSPPRRTACFSRASASGARRRRKRVLRWSCRRRERSPSTRARNIYELPFTKVSDRTRRPPPPERRACLRPCPTADRATRCGGSARPSDFCTSRRTASRRWISLYCSIPPPHNTRVPAAALPAATLYESDRCINKPFPTPDPCAIPATYESWHSGVTAVQPLHTHRIEA